MRTILLLLLPLCLSAQRNAARQEIEQINRAYERLTAFRSEIEYVMYSTHSGSKEIDRQQAVLSRSGDLYLYKIGLLETLTTPQYTIAVDHEEKEIMLGKVYAKRQEKQFGLDLETALMFCDTILLSDPVPGQRLLMLELSMPDVERVELHYDAKTHLMKKVILFYRDEEEWEEGKPETKARMEIIYRQQDSSPVFAEDLFSMERYVRIVGSKFALSPKFKNYTFFNQTDTP